MTEFFTMRKIKIKAKIIFFDSFVFFIGLDLLWFNAIGWRKTFSADLLIEIVLHKIENLYQPNSIISIRCIDIKVFLLAHIEHSLWCILILILSKHLDESIIGILSKISMLLGEYILTVETPEKNVATVEDINGFDVT